MPTQKNGLRGSNPRLLLEIPLHQRICVHYLPLQVRAVVARPGPGLRGPVACRSGGSEASLHTTTHDVPATRFHVPALAVLASLTRPRSHLAERALRQVDTERLLPPDRFPPKLARGLVVAPELTRLSWPAGLEAQLRVPGPLRGREGE